MSGYSRYRVTGVGVGAAEIWQAVFDYASDRAPLDEPLTVGTLLQSYDRSAYVEFADHITDSVDVPGPALVLLAGDSFTGPLATRIRSESTPGFPTSALDPGADCRIRFAIGGPDTAQRFVVSIGRTLDLELDPSVLQPVDQVAVQYGNLQDIDTDSDVWRRAAETLEWLSASQVDDGLGLLSTLDAMRQGSAPDSEISGIVDAWVTVLDTDLDDLPDGAGVSLLGRGPGATPSGDDIVSGILLALHRTTDGRRRDRVERAGASMVAAGIERTTTISTALLAQAALGRTSASVERGLEALLSPESNDDPTDAAREMTRIGHSSGVDMLVGMLLTVLFVAPAVES